MNMLGQKDISVTNKESWELLMELRYYMLTEDIVVDLQEEVLGVGS